MKFVRRSNDGKIKKIRILTAAKLLGVYWAGVGLMCGIAYSFGGTVYDFLTTGSLNSGTALAFLALIGMPVILAIPGFLSGFIGAFLYNFLAGKFGGIEIDIE